MFNAVSQRLVVGVCLCLIGARPARPPPNHRWRLVPSRRRVRRAPRRRNRALDGSTAPEDRGAKGNPPQARSSGPGSAANVAPATSATSSKGATQPSDDDDDIDDESDDEDADLARRAAGPPTTRHGRVVRPRDDPTATGAAAILHRGCGT